MKIVICGSSFFRDKMIENKKLLIEMGHEAIIHPDYEAFARGEKQETWNLMHTDHVRAKKENNYIKWYYDAIVGADAILVLNYDKKGIANYVGGNTLMEIAFAHTNGKKIFLMNPVPQEVSYTDEIEAMYDEVLNDDLSKIDFGDDKVILATGSPYRQAIFRDAGFEFEARASEVDERFDGRPMNPFELVQSLAKLKAQDVSRHYSSGIIVGFDSVGYFNGEILEKPKSEEEAISRLKSLSENSFSFFTGVHMINKSNNKILSRVVETVASMRKLSIEEIRRYLSSDSAYNTYALGFDPIKNISSTFIKNISGSYLNILQGIPLETVIGMLEEIK